MKASLAFLIGILAASPASAIIGGEPVPAGKYPYIVSIYRPDLQATKHRALNQCTGVLLSKNLVLTSSSCLQFNRKPLTKIALNSTEKFLPRKDKMLFRMGRWSSPRNWRHIGQEYNIALIWFKGDHNITQFARLPTRGQVPREGEIVTAVGFGVMSFTGDRSDVLRELTLPITDTASCVERLHDVMYIEGDKVCADACSGERSSTCEGDSGGPVIVNDTVVGIISDGPLCRRGGCFPSVFTVVSEHLPFIETGMLHPEPDRLVVEVE